MGSASLLVIPAWVGAFLTGFPSLRAPLPLLTVLPALVLVETLSPTSVQLIAVVPAGAFLLWNLPLLKGASTIPFRSRVLLGICTCLTVFYFIFAWPDGAKYQGITYTVAICVVNLLWVGLLWILLRQGIRTPSFLGNILFHWMLFAWLSWYAFPWLGELL